MCDVPRVLTEHLWSCENVEWKAQWIIQVISCRARGCVRGGDSASEGRDPIVFKDVKELGHPFLKHITLNSCCMIAAHKLELES